MPRLRDEIHALKQRRAQIVAQQPEQRIAHDRLELRAGDPVLADALGQLHGRQHVDQRRDDRDGEPRPLGEVADLARLVERRDQPGLDAGGERGERPRRDREGRRCVPERSWGAVSRGRAGLVTRGADLSHLGCEPELPSVIDDPRDDDDLLRASDPDAFGAFYARHARAVEAFFARRTGDRVLACDLAGETFAAALDRAPALSTGWRAGAGVALHDRGAAARRPPAPRGGRGAAAAAPDGAPPHRGRRGRRRSRDQEVAGLALALLERLPHEQREAIAAHVVAGHGYRDIARRTGLSEAGVRQRVSRGLATMRRPAQVRLAAERVLDETLTYSLGAGHEVPLEAYAAVARPGLLVLREPDPAPRGPARVRARADLARDRRRLGRGGRGRPPDRLGRRRATHGWSSSSPASTRSACEVGPDATEWRMRVAARERPARAFVPRHWPGL